MLSTPIRSRQMKPSTFMDETSAIVVLDTSVVINLNATGRAPEILNALPLRIVVTEIVVAELRRDRRSGRQDSELLEALARAGHIRVVAIGDAGPSVFGEFVVGPAGDTLDDGEAATIAFAVEHQIAPVIDERKALRICRERFPLPRPICTVDLFAETAVAVALG